MRQRRRGEGASRNGTAGVLGLLVAVVIAAFAAPTPAQILGDTDTLVESITFEVSREQIDLTPSPEGLGQRRRKTFNEDFNNIQTSLAGIAVSALNTFLSDNGFPTIPSWMLALGTPPATAVGGLKFDYGVWFEPVASNQSDVDATYPVEVQIEYPAENTFGCGHDFSIETRCTMKDGSLLAVDPPVYDIKMGFFVDNIRLVFSLDFCGEDPFELVEVCLSDIIGDVDLDTIDIPLGGDVELLTICAEDVLGPFEPGVTELSCLNDSLIGLAFLDEDPIDPENSICISLPPPVPVEVTACFKASQSDDLTCSTSDQGRVLTLEGNTERIARMETDIISWIGAAYGVTTDIDIPQVVTVDPGDISPTWQADQHMKFDLVPTVYIDLDLGVAMDWEVIDPDETPPGMVDSGYGQFVRLEAGHNVDVTFPPLQEDPVDVQPTYDILSDLSSLTWHDYKVGVSLNILQLEVAGGTPYFLLSPAPIITQSISTQPEIDYIIENDTIALTGWEDENIPLLPAFELNPEKPRIEHSVARVVDVVKFSGGERGVVYEIGLRNAGDVALSNVESDFDLHEIFDTMPGYDITCVASGDFTVNPDYDGRFDINLLDVNNTLAVGQDSSVYVLVRVQPDISAIDEAGCFLPVVYASTNAEARGVSPIGTHVRTNWDHCKSEPVDLPPIVLVDLGASVIDELDDYAIYGWKDLHIARSISPSKGNVGSSGEMLLKPFRALPKTVPEIIGDLHLENDLFISQSELILDYAQIAGRIRMNDPASSLTFNGALSEHTGCAALFPQPDLPRPAFDGQMAVLSGPVAPGDYAVVELGPGAEVVLTAGTYDVSLLDIVGDDTAVRFDVSAGPITLNIDQWRTSPHRRNDFVIEGSGSTRDVHINYFGNRQQKLRESLVQGILTAPRAEISFEDGSELNGACHAERVSVKSGSSFIHHEFLEDIWVDQICPTPSGTVSPAVGLVTVGQQASGG